MRSAGFTSSWAITRKGSSTASGPWTCSGSWTTSSSRPTLLTASPGLPPPRPPRRGRRPLPAGGGPVPRLWRPRIRGRSWARLGDTYLAADDPASAGAAWQHALAILDELGDPDAARLARGWKSWRTPPIGAPRRSTTTSNRVGKAAPPATPQRRGCQIQWPLRVQIAPGRVRCSAVVTPPGAEQQLRSWRPAVSDPELSKSSFRVAARSAGFTCCADPERIVNCC